MKWRFEPFDPKHTSFGGDLAKLFKGDEVKAPAVFTADRIPDQASLLMREVTQNAWDSALEMRASKNSQTPPPDFKLTFRFLSFDEEDKKRLAEELGLGELAARRDAATKDGAKARRRDLGLVDDDCLDHLQDGDQPLRLLEVVEQAGGGMYGNWESGKSKLHSALCSFGITRKPSDSGGSFGFGKAALIRGSRIHVVVAYTCFEDQPDEPDVTRRLLGAAYWGEHDWGASANDVRNYPGHGRLGAGLDPYENEEADAVASRIGLTLRNPDTPDDRGTTLLLVEPTVEPADLKRAAERYWWPALQDPTFRFEIEVIDYDNLSHVPRPSKNPDLRPFISSYEVATTRQDASQADHQRWQLNSPAGMDLPTCGTLVLTHQSPGWSYPTTTEDSPEHRSLIALVRSPRMVVEYLTYARTVPFVRGTFVADHRVNDLLRETEPKAHDSWRESASEEDVSPRATTVSRYIMAGIRQRTGQYRNRLKPPADEYGEPRLTVFDRLLKRLKLPGKKRGSLSPPQNVRPFSISPGDTLHFTQDGRQVTGTAVFAFNEKWPGYAQLSDKERIRVSIKYTWVGNDNAGIGDRATMLINEPVGFVPAVGQSDTFDGYLAKDGTAAFVYETEEYTEPWTGKLVIKADILRDEAAHST